MKFNFTQFKAVFAVFVASGLLASCCSFCHQDNIVEVHVDWQQQPVKIVKCRPAVEYSGRGFSFKGFTVSIPSMGGSANVGGFDYKPQTLNKLFESVAILDLLRLQYCDMLVAEASLGKDEFRECNERIVQQTTKIAYLAMSAQRGEAAVKEATETYGEAGPLTTAPTNAATKKLDNAAANTAKQDAAASAAAGTSPAPRALTPGVSTSLPPRVAAVVTNVPKSTLLKMARQPAPRTSLTTPQ